MPDSRPSWPVVAAVAAVALAASAGALWASHALATSFSIALYVVAISAALLDLFDLSVRVYLCRRRAGGEAPHAAVSVPLARVEYTPRQKRVHLRPYAIVASIHNAQAELHGFMKAMAAYRDRFWLVDDASSDATVALLRREGWRVAPSAENRKKPGALRALLSSLPPEIETVLVIDPDIRIRDASVEGLTRLESVVFEFQRSGMAAACPRIAILEDGLLARFQGLEYCMSFALGRRSLGDACVNSGISIYRRADLEEALSRHSLSVYAEDLENSMHLLGSGRSIYYDGRLVVDTEGKRTWKGWFSQRVGWNYGLIRVYAEGLASVLRVGRTSMRNGYHFLFYTGVLSILLQPLKVAGLALIALGLAEGLDGLLGLDVLPATPLAEPAYVVGAWLKYTVLATLGLLLAVPRAERAPLVPIVPLYFFYSLAHIVPVTVGYANWVWLRLFGRRLYADHYQDETHLHRARARRAQGGRA